MVDLDMAPKKMAPSRGSTQLTRRHSRARRTVIDEVSRTFATKTASMFLNPALEHEAVTRALGIADNQCKWTQWQDGAAWKDLLSLTIVVPPPRTAKGYGLAVERAEGFVKQAAAAAAGHIKDFETGKIKSIDEL